MRKRCKSLWVTALVLAGAFLAAPAHSTGDPSVPPPVSGGLAHDTATIGLIVVVPGTGEYVSLTPGLRPPDPNQYMADMPCRVEEDKLDPKCLAAQKDCPPRSADDKPGVPVIWKTAPKAIDDPEWTDWSANGKPTCLYDARAQDLLPLIAERMEKEIKSLPIKAGTATLQPAPHTLRGAETNIYAEAAEQGFDIVLLGQKIHVTVTPVEYTYNYGDGSTLGPTPVSGGPLPEDEWGTKTRTSHVYTATGNYPVSVTTSFTGTYSVNGGPPLPITGRGSATSAPQTIQVWRSITKNYADNCIQNPHGEGC
ncbi:hypothetical protein ACQR35_06795 [Pseudarthrobacter sp. J1738]|uniref:hypothetical protein n=1 Tax=Pseudarthrobacter sp. J1738 TaxID=3420446 RepID=UPI003D2A798B